MNDLTHDAVRDHRTWMMEKEREKKKKRWSAATEAAMILALVLVALGGWIFFEEYTPASVGADEAKAAEEEEAQCGQRMTARELHVLGGCGMLTYYAKPGMLLQDIAEEDDDLVQFYILEAAVLTPWPVPEKGYIYGLVYDPELGTFLASNPLAYEGPLLAGVGYEPVLKVTR